MLYLVRHGKAEAGGDDDLRRLTEDGRQTVLRVARLLARAGVHVDRLEHSGLARARETAEILAATIGGRVEAVGGMEPNADVATFARRLPVEGNIMLVGHNPFMERLASYLLTGDVDPPLLHFRAGSVACLQTEEGRRLLEWFLAPRLA